MKITQAEIETLKQAQITIDKLIKQTFGTPDFVTLYPVCNGLNDILIRLDSQEGELTYE